MSETMGLLTFFSVYATEIGPSPFQRMRLINRFFSWPVSSSTTIVSTDAVLALKLNVTR